MTSTRAFHTDKSCLCKIVEGTTGVPQLPSPRLQTCLACPPGSFLTAALSYICQGIKMLSAAGWDSPKPILGASCGFYLPLHSISEHKNLRSSTELLEFSPSPQTHPAHNLMPDGHAGCRGCNPCPWAFVSLNLILGGKRQGCFV